MTVECAWRFLLLACLAWGVGAQLGETPDCDNVNSVSLSSCTSISGSDCGSSYSHSIFPNSVTSTITFAQGQLSRYETFLPFFGSCSDYVMEFICLALMPYCDPSTPIATGLPPCRSLCEDVTRSCETAVTTLSGQDFSCLFSNCTRFPTENCIDKDHPIIQEVIKNQLPTEATPPSNESAPSSCPLPNNTFFSDSAKSFAVGWVSVWSVLCFLSTTITVLTFLLDTTRFQYPWRPVVYLAIIFNVHSLTYFFALALGRNIVTCPGGRFVTSGDSWTWSHTPCILIFIFLYYTMMAGFLWWVILTTCWFLVAALKWSHESVSKLAPFFQAVAWSLPLIMTIALLASRVIGADELTATCFVVSNGTTPSFLALLLGVIVPLALFLLTGLVFLLLGFVSLLRVRAYMRRGGKQEEQQSLEKLIIRIGIFVAVYVIPASVLIGCFVYELASRPSWKVISDPCTDCTRPNSAVFMLRIFMFLLIGVLTGVWIWSRKTLKSWQQLPERCGVCCRQSAAIGEEDVKQEDVPPPYSADNMMMSPRMPSFSYPDSGMESS